ncbi:MAG: DUF547 domain-containing protein, partial [Candidatus Neomarinimicrobiota bacterium]
MGILFSAWLIMMIGNNNADLVAELLPQDVAFDAFDSVLETYVDSTGRVDYTSLRRGPSQLGKFLRFVKEVSPENRPDLFMNEDEKKAYWINVYNALVIKAVVDHPGIAGVGEITWGKGIFWRRKFQAGGRKMTLYHIEHRILRNRFRDPRIHFAISCASNSCPPLGNRMVTGADLDAQLEERTARFIRNESDVRVDHGRKEVRLSRIFKWYRKDFTANGESLLEYVVRYL